MPLQEKTYLVEDYVLFRDKVLKLAFSLKKIVIFKYIGFIPEESKYKVVLLLEPELEGYINQSLREGQLK